VAESLNTITEAENGEKIVKKKMRTRKFEDEDLETYLHGIEDRIEEKAFYNQSRYSSMRTTDFAYIKGATRQNRSLQRYEDQQKQWKMMNTKIGRKSKRSETNTLMNRIDEFREKK
jgi:hypothetical protein